MAKAVLLVTTNCPEGREAEFSEWYTKIHIPDVLEIPGFVAATRYELAGSPMGGQGKFLVIYELDTDDTDRAWSDLQKVLAEKRQQGRMSDLLQVVAFGFYKPTSTHP